MDVLYSKRGWMYCIQREDRGIVYKVRMEVLNIRRGWRYCIKGDDGGIV